MFSWQVVSTIFMFNHNDYWFVKAYIGLYLLSPALNMFVKNLTQTQFKTILILLLSFQTIYGWIDINGVDWIAGGYSAYSFMILYLLARYVRKYMADKISFSFIKLFFSYLLIGLFQAIVGYLLTSFGYSVSGRLFTYTNPIVIIQSLLLVLAFSKLNFKSRIVNILSTSCLAIYLFHGNELILRPIYGKMIADWFFQLSFIPSFSTYNRGELLKRLYQSLVAQQYKNFEWLIVDDGSTDYTEEIVSNIEESMSTSKFVFPIIYYKQKNGGKHRAINKGVSLATGELFFIVDSDDMLPSKSLSYIVEEYAKIRGDQTFAGICGLDADSEGRIIGSGLQEEVIEESSIIVRYKVGVTGDMKEVFRTDILRQFPFPEFPNERFVPEILVWNRIAKLFKLRYFNKVIYTVEYQPDGLTKAITVIRRNSPRATCQCYKEMLMLDIPLKYKLRALLNYLRFRQRLFKI